MKKFIANISVIWKEEKYFIPLVFIVAFLLRFFYVLTLKNEFYFDDSYQWNAMAWNFLAGKGLIVNQDAMALRMPLYPIFLSAIYFICGYNMLAVRIFQTTISALTCVLIYFVGKEIFNKKVGNIASSLCVIYPFFIYYSGAILAENLYIFLLVLMMLFLVKKKNILAGIFLGLGTLCRAETSFFIIFIFLGFFITLEWRKALKSCFFILIPFLIFLFPWVMRNYLIFHKFVPLSTQGGVSIYAGNNSLNKTGGGISGRDFVIPQVTAGMSELEIDQYLKKEAINFIKNNPRQCLKLYWKKFKYFWNITS